MEPPLVVVHLRVGNTEGPISKVTLQVFQCIALKEVKGSGVEGADWRGSAPPDVCPHRLIDTSKSITTKQRAVTVENTKLVNADC